MIVSVLMFTTAGSTCLAIFENSEESWDGEGIAIAVAPGEIPGLSAFTERLITVPITTPMASVARIREKNRSFRLLMVSIILSINEIMGCRPSDCCFGSGTMQWRFQNKLIQRDLQGTALFLL